MSLKVIPQLLRLLLFRMFFCPGVFLSWSYGVVSEIKLLSPACYCLEPKQLATSLKHNCPKQHVLLSKVKENTFQKL